MRAHVAGLTLGILLTASGAWAQANPESQVVSSTQRTAEATSPDYSAVNCASFVSDDKVAEDIRLVSGEESISKVVFSGGDNVHINKGATQGVHVGDRFFVVRPEQDPNQVEWFAWQHRLIKALGTLYRDKGQLRVVNVQPNFSIAEVTFSCEYMQRGDIVRPMQERPSPPYKPVGEFDRFAPASGKPVGTVVLGKDNSQQYGKNSIIYANIGSNQGVTVGSYLRLFRQQGQERSHAESARYLGSDYRYEIYGFGSTPARYAWNELPRDVLGEGIVLSVSHNSATVFITYSRFPSYAGDYVELE